MACVVKTSWQSMAFVVKTSWQSIAFVVKTSWHGWLLVIVSCRACYGVLRFIMESGAKGCEVIVSGKLRAQRAKAMKFKDGYMIASGHPAVEYIDGCVRHVMLRQGVLGIKVKFSFLCWF